MQQGTKHIDDMRHQHEPPMDLPRTGASAAVEGSGV